MSTYYRPPRQHATTTDSAQASPQQPEPRALDIPDQSIYIFPTPSSLPPSPSGSSVFSVPSDFSDQSILIDTRSRNHSVSSHASTNRSHIRARRRPTSATRRSYAQRSLSPNISVISDEEVEVWDWMAESGEDMPDEDGLWEFEAEIERTSRWGIPNDFEIITRPRAASRTTSPFTATNDFIDQHYRIYLRSRTHSNTSNITGRTTRTSRSTDYTPHPRIHIPLLSFFASLLFLDLDDPALRLLSQSTPDSVLFPGQGGLLDAPDVDYRSSDQTAGAFTPSSSNDLLDVPKSHGLFRLLTDGSLHHVKVLKDGLAVVCDPNSPLPSSFPLPGFNAIQGLGRLVGGLWSKGSRAWQEMTLPPSLPT